MKVLVQLLLSQIFFLITSQAGPLPTDSLRSQQTYMAKRQDQLSKQVDSLSAKLTRLANTNDSLNKELYYYRAKDDFYVMAVDRQGSHFEWLLGIALAVAGLFTYGYFRDRIEKVRDEFSRSIQGYRREKNSMLRKLHEQSSFSLSTTGIMMGLLKKMVGKGDEPDALLTSLSLQQAGELIQAYFLVDQTDAEAVELSEANLNSCLTTLLTDISRLYQENQLNVTVDSAKILFKHDSRRAIESLNASISQIKDVIITTKMMSVLVKINELKQLIDAQTV